MKRTFKTEVLNLDKSTTTIEQRVEKVQRVMTMMEAAGFTIMGQPDRITTDGLETYIIYAYKQ